MGAPASGAFRQERRRGRPAAWSGDAARGKLSRRLSAKSPANTPGRAVRLKGRAVKGSAVKGSAVKGSAVKGGVARGSVVTSPAGPWHVRRGVWQAAIAVIAILGLVAVGFLAFGGSGGASARPARTAAVAQYPPARLAGADFGTDPGHPARGIFQSVSAVAAAGGTIVAVGSLTGQWIPRAQFLVSADGGHSWRLAPVRAPGGVGALACRAAAAGGRRRRVARRPGRLAGPRRRGGLDQPGRRGLDAGCRGRGSPRCMRPTGCWRWPVPAAASWP